VAQEKDQRIERFWLLQSCCVSCDAAAAPAGFRTARDLVSL